MITAHLPSGYILGRLWPNAPGVLAAAIVGGILPDFDLIWFYFIDDRAFHHHRYWVHAPAFWAVIAVVVLPLTRRKVPTYTPAVCAFFGALLLHILLDSISGDIMWLWPWRTDLFALITIPAIYDQWILNFIFHPVFLLELSIWGFAAWCFFRKAK